MDTLYHNNSHSFFEKPYNVHTDDLPLLAAKVNSLSSSAITELDANLNPDFKDYIKYLKEPVTRSCVEVKSMRTTLAFGKFHHTNPIISKFCGDMLDRLETPLKSVVGKLALANPLGFAMAEPQFQIKDKRLIVKSIENLDTSRITIRGFEGTIREVRYYDDHSNRLPYPKVIHITNNYTSSEGFNPFGVPEMATALPYIKAKLAILSSMVLNGKNLATGILTASVPEKTVALYAPNGKPMKKLPASQAVLQQLKKLESNNFIITDNDTTLGSLKIPDGSSFYFPCLEVLDKYIKRSFLVPDLVFSEGTNALAKTATLAGKHFSLMDSTIEEVVRQIREELISKVMRPVIIHNFGKQDNYGEFVEEKTIDEGSEQLYLTNLYQAINQGILNAQDPYVINKVRSILHLPDLKEVNNDDKISSQLQTIISKLTEGKQPNQTQSNKSPSE